MRLMFAVSLGLLVGSGSLVFAKELPRRASAPVATGCEWAGPGFVKAEGSSTCVKVGGSVRAEYGASSGK